MRRPRPIAAALQFVRRRPIVASATLAGLCPIIGGWIGTQGSLQRVRDSETLAWRAHAHAVHVTKLLAGILGRVGELDGIARSDLAGLLAGDHLRRALELSRGTVGVWWHETDRCLDSPVEL